MPQPHGAANPRGRSRARERLMAQQKGSTGQDAPQQRAG